MRNTLLGDIAFSVLVVLQITIAGGTGFAQGLRTWNGFFVDQTDNQLYPFTMVGDNPSFHIVNSPIPVYLVPVKVTFSTSTCTPAQTTFDPYTITSNGLTSVQNLTQSPIFTAIDSFHEGTQLQYVDAFQRAPFAISDDNRRANDCKCTFHTGRSSVRFH